jgi:hypothetical protein
MNDTGRPGDAATTEGESPTSLASKPGSGGYLFRFFWGVTALAFLVLLGFFLIGLGDGSVSPFNIGTWATILGGVGVVLGGSFALRRVGKNIAAMIVILVVALPVIAYALLFAMLILSHPGWN